ncbi:MAG: tRNA preQ1(34) S-adenosylmethionine ribosyltransferase-isomerase QueA [Planctomycetota bacterium]|nr:MAG: tRNA preQ1(34) S-adenosylmethionine ribosyltransferase-isomerase QueA [Planctomycetota bacterium]
MQRSDFQYELEPGRIAREPAEPRDGAKLLVCRRVDGALVEHAQVRDLPRFLRPGDRLVLNETRVLPHRLYGRRASGGRVQCLILRRDGDEALAFLKPSNKLRPGEVLSMEDGALEIELLEKLGRGKHRIRLAAGEGVDLALERVGRAPLPPYIERDPEREDRELDRERYQTVFAREPGAVAAPTAGLHLTAELLAQLAEQGIASTRVVLHVGEGTFEPLRAEEIESHEMHEERFVLSEESAAELEDCKAAGGRVFCVGTTSARVLESCWDGSRLVPGRGSTRLFLYPGKGPNFLDGILTNFHLPESTLLMLVASILGREETLALYEEAKRQGYRFFSFGDAMLILP